MEKQTAKQVAKSVFFIKKRNAQGDKTKMAYFFAVLEERIDRSFLSTG